MPERARQLLRAGAREHGQGAGRGQAELAPAGQRRAGEAAGIGVEDGVEHLVVGQPGLDEEPPAVGAGSEQAGGAGQQDEGLLVGPEAWREQLVVDVQEGHHVGRGTRWSTASVPTKTAAGAAAAASGALPRDLDDRAPGRGLQLLPQPADPRPQHDQRARAAHLAHDGALRPAAGAAQQAVAGLGHRGLAALAALQRPARAAGQPAGPARRVRGRRPRSGRRRAAP